MYFPTRPTYIHIILLFRRQPLFHIVNEEILFQFFIIAFLFYLLFSHNVQSSYSFQHIMHIKVLIFLHISPLHLSSLLKYYFSKQLKHMQINFISFSCLSKAYASTFIINIYTRTGTWIVWLWQKKGMAMKCSFHFLHLIYGKYAHRICIQHECLVSLSFSFAFDFKCQKEIKSFG